ncbi:META domain-containing protein [Formosa sediminum]|uniref:META domain-containing protein n=1 Tax=Formosa sediminum TaxID=2594004 RepID=A0A516GM20_9FLAO|nr:META domain-containing protein [Formosa sediminum]QDO92557.1 META domain-containing protein [Formosa sediminum]
MKHLLNSLLSLLFILIVSCGHSKKETNKSDSTVKSITNSIAKTTAADMPEHNTFAFFKSSGENSEWNLELSENAIKFSIKTEDYYFPLPKPVLASDANIKSYRTKTELGHINIKIAMTECVDAQSKTHPYSVSIDFKQASATDFTTYQGCGDYITDYRLHDIWVLETIANDSISIAHFAKELPKMEINTRTNTFMGYAGCNTMNGTIFSEQSKIRFTKIAVTKKMCLQDNLEAQFIKALKRSTEFKIENNRLYLSNPDENTLTFKKVD